MHNLIYVLHSRDLSPNTVKQLEKPFQAWMIKDEPDFKASIIDTEAHIIYHIEHDRAWIETVASANNA